MKIEIPRIPKLCYRDKEGKELSIEDLEPLLNKLKEEQEYWKAYDDVTQIFSSEVAIDYTEVKKTLQECETLCEQYKKEFDSLNSVNSDRIIKEFQEKFTKQAENCESMKGIFFINKQIS